MSNNRVNSDNEYLTPEETSQLTSIPVNSLAVLRSRKEKFPFYKMGRNIRYKKSEIIAVIESGKVDIEENK